MYIFFCTIHSHSDLFHFFFLVCLNNPTYENKPWNVYHTVCRCTFSTITSMGGAPLRLKNVYHMKDHGACTEFN